MTETANRTATPRAEPAGAPSPEQVLASALEDWKPWFDDEHLPCNGSDMVEWFFGAFADDARRALGRAPPSRTNAPQETANGRTGRTGDGTARTAPSEAFCPRCGKKTDHPSIPGGFLEIGEYDGKSYEEEFDVVGRSCSSCGHGWYEQKQN